MDRDRYDANPDPNPDRHQNGKSDSDPDRHQNDADPQHWKIGKIPQNHTEMPSTRLLPSISLDVVEGLNR